MASLNQQILDLTEAKNQQIHDLVEDKKTSQTIHTLRGQVEGLMKAKEHSPNKRKLAENPQQEVNNEPGASTAATDHDGDIVLSDATSSDKRRKTLAPHHPAAAASASNGTSVIRRDVNMRAKTQASLAAASQNGKVMPSLPRPSAAFNSASNGNSSTHALNNRFNFRLSTVQQQVTPTENIVNLSDIPTTPEQKQLQHA